MAKAIAIAQPFDPIMAAAESAANSLKALGHIMYGTRERTNGTVVVALLLATLGLLIQDASMTYAPYCATMM